MGCQLTGKTLGVIGLGRIGREVTRRASLGLGMRVIGFDPVMAPAAISQLGIETAPSVDSLLPHCDFITVHTPLTDETRDMIGAKQLALLPKGARVINCARGGIINEPALADALKSGHVAGAAFDVFVEEPIAKDHPFLALSTTVLTPHLGASTVEAQDLVARESAQLLVDFLCKGQVRFAVNMAALDRTVAKRTTVASCSLMAPACSMEFFQAHYRPRLGAAATAVTRIERLKIYNLDDQAERSDSVTALYNKSLLYLVSNAFEPTTGAEKAKPLLGLAKYADRIGTSLLDIAYAPASKATHSTSHGGFDNDPATLNDILGRILGATPTRLFSKSDLDY